MASSQLGGSGALYANIPLDKADTKSLVLTHSITPTTLHWLKQSKAHPDSRGNGHHLLMEKDRSLCTGACEMAAIVVVVFGKIESSTRRKKNVKVIQNVYYSKHELTTGRKNLVEISSWKR